MSIFSVADIRRGVLRLPPGIPRDALNKWFAQLLESFNRRILFVDRAVALRWAELAANAESIGRPGSLADGMIAATSVEHGLTLVTRNSADFKAFGVTQINPWKA